MFKLLTYAGYDNKYGPHIFPIEPDIDRSIEHIKMARQLPEKIEAYIKSAEPIPGKTQLLIDAMGSSDYYGSNINGDYFPTAALDHKGPEYGYETFMHYGYPYKFHVNKDPAKAYGDKVTLADYDRNMHRVLLIIRVNDQKCQDILGDLAANRYWDVSMGCRVPQDFCSICGNAARNRGEYCAHLRYQMNKILPDGRRVCAINRRPKFFDISFVPIGAEKASHVLKKVANDTGARGVLEVWSSAELGERYYEKLAAAERKIAGEKSADITKEVPANNTKIEGVTSSDQQKMDEFMADAGQVKAQEEAIPPATLDALAQFPLKNVFATLAALGIDLRPQEFQRIILIKQGGAALMHKLAAHRLVFDERHPAPRPPKWSDEFAKLSIFDANEKIAMLLRPFVAERSCYPEILAARLQRFEKRADFEGYNRDSQWYPMTDEGKRLSSGVPGLIPASIALAAGFLVFRRAFPQLIEKSPAPIRTLAAQPWLLPVLIGAGVGASVGMSTLTASRPITPNGTGTGLDGKNSAVYHQPKIAGINPVLIGPASLAYYQSGVQQTMTRSDLKKHAAEPETDSLDASIVAAVHRLARRKSSVHAQ